MSIEPEGLEELREHPALDLGRGAAREGAEDVLARRARPRPAMVEFVPPPLRAGADHSNTEALGRVLYTDYVYPFELAAVVLLVAIVAAIALTHRRRKGVKAQDPAEQVKVRREDRVRLVSMEAEDRP